MTLAVATKHSWEERRKVNIYTCPQAAHVWHLKEKERAGSESSGSTMDTLQKSSDRIEEKMLRNRDLDCTRLGCTNRHLSD